MPDPAIARLDIVPDYSRGFLFHWTVRGGFNDPRPWTFTVQGALSKDGPWVPVSPGLRDVMSWRAPGGLRVNKSDVLWLRVALSTPSGEYASLPRSPYGDLSRREFLLASEIMRKEVLHMSNMAGTECVLYSVADYGPRCPQCTDPVTGQCRNAHCRVCLGTGFDPPYVASARSWCSFSEDNQHQLSEGPEGNGMREQKRFNVRIACAVPVKKDDILHDVGSGRRYYVRTVQVAAELRRIPLVATLVVDEIAVTDPAYKVGEA